MNLTRSEDNYPTKYWHLIEDGRVQCDLCPRFCKLRNGQRGLCFVRGCENNEVVLKTYGRSSGFCIDPIEKKPLHHFYPGTPVLSFGTAGCNLACKFCQNWDISKSREMDILASRATPEAIARAAKETGCTSVAFTYNDPVIFLEYAVDTARACRDLGIKTVAVTAGEINDAPRREFFEHIDAANVDLKAFTESFYRKLCNGDLKTVLDTLVFLREETDTWLEVTTLLIPDENDSDTELEGLTRWIADNLGSETPLHFSAFHPTFRIRDKRSTPASTLSRAREIAMNNSLRYVYTGNVHDEAGGSTYCHECGTKLIGRDWYIMTGWNLDETGACVRCKTPCAGYFESSPGEWGAKQKAVDINSFNQRTNR